MSAAVTPHDRQHGARHSRQAEEVDLEHAPDFLLVALFNRGEIPDAGVIHQHVDSSKAFLGALRRCVDLDWIRYVQLEDQCAILSTLDDVFRFGGIARGDDGRVTSIENHLGQLAAEAGRAAGDEPNFVVLHFGPPTDTNCWE